jgi:hypothetical protein
MQIEIIKNSKKFVGLSLVIVVLSLGAFFVTMVLTSLEEIYFS